MSYTERILAQPRGMRRVLALSLVPLLALTIWAGVVLPLHWIATSQEEWRDDTRRSLARARGYAGTVESLKKQVDALPAAAVWQRLYALKGGEGGSAVQQDVLSLCTAAGLSNPAVTVLPSEPAGRLMKYTVRLTANGDADRFKLFLARLRGQPRYLRIDRLNVTAPPTQAEGQNPDLTVSLDIAGYSSPAPAVGAGRT